MSKNQEHCVYQRVSSLCNFSMLFIGSLFFHAVPGSQLLGMESFHRFRSQSFMASTKSSGGNCRGAGVNSSH